MPVAELTTDKSTIVHKKSGRKITYGEVVAFATCRPNRRKSAKPISKSRRSSS
ncbi:MAG TPA: hypothetical protein VI137_11350 [Pseudolabrys sp.]